MADRVGDRAQKGEEGPARSACEAAPSPFRAAMARCACVRFLRHEAEAVAGSQTTEARPGGEMRALVGKVGLLVVCASVSPTTVLADRSHGWELAAAEQHAAAGLGNAATTPLH